jgi:hypothetical protein
VKLAKPVFVVEPSGNYRASADPEHRWRCHGSNEHGPSDAKVVATSSEIQLNNFTAAIFKGRASGSARIALQRNGSSHVVANLSGLDIGGPLTAIAGSTVPLTGRATGNVDLTFPGTDYKVASGTLTTQLRAEAGDNAADRIPITGDCRGSCRPRVVQYPATKPQNSGDNTQSNRTVFV